MGLFKGVFAVGVPDKAVAVVKAARAWAPLFRLAKNAAAETHKAQVEKRGGPERVKKDLRDATDRLAEAVLELEAELKKTPAPRRSRKPIDWGAMFGVVAEVAGAAHKAMRQQNGIPTHVIDAQAEDVT